MRRATSSISPKLMSAVASATMAGTTVTGISAPVASATSILSRVIDCDAIGAQLRIGRDHVAIDAVMQERKQDVALADGGDQRLLGE